MIVKTFALICCIEFHHCDVKSGIASHLGHSSLSICILISFILIPANKNNEDLNEACMLTRGLMSHDTVNERRIQYMHGRSTYIYLLFRVWRRDIENIYYCEALRRMHPWSIWWHLDTSIIIHIVLHQLMRSDYHCLRSISSPSTGSVKQSLKHIEIMRCSQYNILQSSTSENV